LGWAAIASTTQHQKEVDFAWWSADGVSWQAAQPAPFGVTNIFADDAGFIAVGNYFPNGSGCAIDPKQAVGLTFTSTDGLLWRRLSEDGWMSQYIEQLRTLQPDVDRNRTGFQPERPRNRALSGRQSSRRSRTTGAPCRRTRHCPAVAAAPDSSKSSVGNRDLAPADLWPRRLVITVAGYRCVQALEVRPGAQAYEDLARRIDRRRHLWLCGIEHACHVDARQRLIPARVH